MDFEKIREINRKMMLAGSEKESDDNRAYVEKESARGGKGKYRKMFQTPNSYKDYEKDVVKDCLKKELPIILGDFEESYETQNYKDYVKYVLGNKYFIKTLKKNLDKFDEAGMVAFMSAEQLLKNKFVYNDEELRTSYEELFFNIMSKKFEKFMKKFDLDEKIAKELFINICVYDKIRPAHIQQRTWNVLHVLYERAGQYKDPIDIFEKLFKKYYWDSLVGILLECRTNQNNLSDEAKEVWSSFTNYALDEVETKMDKDDIKKFLNIYIQCIKSLRKRGEHLPRVSLLNHISEEYEKISKAVKKIINEDENNKKYFM